MFREKYICNPCPKFIIPKAYKKRPSFIRYAIKCALKTDVARNEIHFTILPRDPSTGKIVSRKRRLNEHRARALRAVVPAMIYYFNIASTLVMASVEKLSDACGLSTCSKAGNKSITRTSRLITDFMEPMGFVKCQKVWDNVMGMYMPKIIHLTPLFFELINISEKKFNTIRKKQLNWVNRCQKKENGFEMTTKEMEKRARDKHIECSFYFREKSYFLIKQKRKAVRIVQLEEKNARSYILNSLVKKYSVKELCDMGVVALKRQVNIEYCKLKKLARNYT